MRILYLTIIIFGIITSAYSFETISIENENKNQNYILNQSEAFPISEEEISELEKIVFKKSDSSKDLQKRFLRLEQEIFGMEQKGDIEERFENLVTASDYYKSGYRQNETVSDNKLNSKNYIQNYNFNNEPKTEYSEESQNYNYYDDTENKQKQSKIKQFFSNLADILSTGSVTGYTPSINSFGLDPFYNFSPFGGANYTGIPMSPSGVFLPGRRYNSINRYPYRKRNPYRTYPLKKKYYPQSPINNYHTGAGVKIIH